MTDRDKIIEMIARGIQKTFQIDASSADMAAVISAALQAEGMAVVPRDATDQMEAAYWRAQGMDRGSCQDTWAAMLAASPYGKAGKEKDDE